MGLLCVRHGIEIPGSQGGARQVRALVAAELGRHEKAGPLEFARRLSWSQHICASLGGRHTEERKVVREVLTPQPTHNARCQR